MAKSEVFNMDCLEFMRSLPDNAFDICIADPPYGDACSQSVQVERERERERDTDKARTSDNRTDRGAMQPGGWNRFGQCFDRYKNLESRSLAQLLPTERERERER